MKQTNSCLQRVTEPSSICNDGRPWLLSFNVYRCVCVSYWSRNTNASDRQNTRFYMHPQLGGGLPQLLIGNESRHLCFAVCGSVSTGQATLL